MWWGVACVKWASGIPRSIHPVTASHGGRQGTNNGSHALFSPRGNFRSAAGMPAVSGDAGNGKQTAGLPVLWR